MWYYLGVIVSPFIWILIIEIFFNGGSKLDFFVNYIFIEYFSYDTIFIWIIISILAVCLWLLGEIEDEEKYLFYKTLRSKFLRVFRFILILTVVGCVLINSFFCYKDVQLYSQGNFYSTSITIKDYVITYGGKGTIMLPYKILTDQGEVYYLHSWNKDIKKVSHFNIAYMFNSSDEKIILQFDPTEIS